MDLRHEIKHEISYSDMLILRQRLRAVTYPDPHTIDGKYFIRSLYFDNLSDKALMEKINGVNRREKFRIRYYNGDTSVIHLEKKSKIDSMSFGGGRGNGKEFNMSEFIKENSDDSESTDGAESGESSGQSDPTFSVPDFGNGGGMPDFGGGMPDFGGDMSQFDPSNMPEGFTRPDSSGSETTTDGEKTERGGKGGFGGGNGGDKAGFGNFGRGGRSKDSSSDEQSSTEQTAAASSDAVKNMSVSLDASQGFDPSQFGGNMPDGFDPSQMPGGGFGGGNMPEGFDPSQFGGGNMPDGFTSPNGRSDEARASDDNAGTASSEQTETAETTEKPSETKAPDKSGDRSGSPQMGSFPQMNGGSRGNDSTGLILLGVSALCLILGIVFAAVFKR